MAVQSAARGSGSLLAGVSVAVTDAAMPTLCTTWWLTELGATVSGTLPDDSSAEGLAAIARRRLQPPAADAPPAYAIRTRFVEETDGGSPADGCTVLTLVDPQPGGGPVGWSAAATWATSGLASLTRSISGDRDADRVRVPADDHAAYVAGSFGAAALLAVEWAVRHGRPRPAAVEVDLQEALAALIQQPVAAAQLQRGALPAVFHAPGGVKQASDGLVYVQAVEPTHWARLLAQAGGVEGVSLSDPPPMSELIANREAIDGALDRWVATARVDELVARLQDAHLPAAPVSRPADLPADAHLAARRFFATGAPTVPWIRALADGAPMPERPAHRRRPSNSLPLEGLRVLDLTWAWAGPFATTVLADLGAEVVNIEWWPRPSNLRTQNPSVAPGSPDGCGWWSANQRGKLSVGVNLKSAEGVRVVHDLAAVSDVAIENFSAGVADRLGVGAEALQRRNPGLVFASLSAFGAGGPHAHWIGYGTQLIAASGMARAMVADDEDVALMGIPYPDPLAGLAAAIAVLAAVGQGTARLDVSMLEAACLPIAGTIERGLAATDRTWTPAVVECADGRSVLAVRMDGTLDDVAGTASSRSAAEVVAAVRAAGGQAVPVATPDSVVDDERLVERGFWRPDLAPRLHRAGVVTAGPPFTIDGERPRWWRGAPDLFEDTTAVLRDVLGYDQHTIDSLAALGAVAIEADAPALGR